MCLICRAFEEDAHITLLKGDDEIFKTVKTDYYGNATIDLEYENDGTVLLTIKKRIINLLRLILILCQII